MHAFIRRSRVLKSLTGQSATSKLEKADAGWLNGYA